MGRLSSVGTHLHFNPAPILRNICLHACHTFTCATKFQTQSQDAGTPRGRPDEGQEGGGDDGGTAGRGVEVARAPRTHSAFCSHKEGVISLLHGCLAGLPWKHSIFCVLQGC